MKLNLWPLCFISYKFDLGRNDAGQVVYGRSYACFIKIRKDVADDKGILAHELEHVRQAWRLLLIGHALLLYYPPYRAWCERKAMIVQLSVK
jgi:hypothetical protein